MRLAKYVTVPELGAEIVRLIDADALLVEIEASMQEAVQKNDMAVLAILSAFKNIIEQQPTKENRPG